MIKRKPLTVARTSPEKETTRGERRDPLRLKRGSLVTARIQSNSCELLEQASNFVGRVRRQQQSVRFSCTASIRTPVERCCFQRVSKGPELDQTESKMTASTRIMSCTSSPQGKPCSSRDRLSDEDALLSMLQSKNKQIMEMEAKLVDYETVKAANKAKDSQLEQVQGVIARLQQRSHIFNGLLEKAGKIVSQSVLGEFEAKSHGKRNVSSQKPKQRQKLNVTQCAQYAGNLHRKTVSNAEIANTETVARMNAKQRMAKEAGVIGRMNLLKERLKRVLTNSARRITILQGKATARLRSPIP